MLNDLLASYDYIKNPTGQTSLMQAPQQDNSMMSAALMSMGGGGRRRNRGGGAPIKSDGSWDELMIEQPGGYSTGLHLHAASGNLPLKRIANKLENKFGVEVGELSGFQGEGKVTSGHSPNSLHYQGNAFDVNYYGDGSEMDVLKQVQRWLDRRF